MRGAYYPLTIHNILINSHWNKILTNTTVEQKERKKQKKIKESMEYITKHKQIYVPTWMCSCVYKINVNSTYEGVKEKQHEIYNKIT